MDGGRKTRDDTLRVAPVESPAGSAHVVSSEDTGHHIGILLLSGACCPTSGCIRRRYAARLSRKAFGRRPGGELTARSVALR